MDLKDRKLLRIKRVATGLLLAAALVYVAASLIAPRYPPASYIAATCEAAMVGALADWFAVVALFRRPLNLPLPHTAIIPRNKARIAQGLGEFIQEQFLSTPALVAKIKEVDPARRLATWLLTRENSATLASYATRLLSYSLGALDDRRVRDFLRATLTAKLHELDLAALAGRVLDVLTENRRHHALLEHALSGVHTFLSRAEMRAYVAGEISKQWPLGRWIAEALRLDEMAAARMLNFVIAKLGEVGSDPQHELRTIFDVFIQQFIERLKTDPQVRIKAEQLRNDTLANPIVAEYLSGLWAALKAHLEADLKCEESAIRCELTEFIANLGARLDAEPNIRDWINEQIVRAVPPLVAEHRAAVGRFIERQVNTWQDEKLVHELERHIGSDLQHIRINGTLVGGAAGLGIYSLTQFLGSVH